MHKVSVAVPNWNGSDDLPDCLDSLLAQSLKPRIIVVDNGSTDGSLELLQTKYPSVEVVSLSKNHGFAGGVNAGIKKAIRDQAEYIALLNNDAVAHKNWIGVLYGFLEANKDVGIATSKILDNKKEHLDSTGEMYTIWGLTYPRSRGEAANNHFAESVNIFGASAGASMYRVEMIRDVGLFDEDFFAYYEDADLSFRAQLAGWKVAYVPGAEVYHQIGATGGKIKGFYTYQTLKNLPQLLWKNVPASLMVKVFPRFVLAYVLFWGRAISRGQVWASSKGVFMSVLLWPKKLAQRRKIQKARKVPASYINSMITHDLPPEARSLRKLRAVWWRVLRKKST